MLRLMEPKRLYRSTTNRKIAGVCGGMGDYFDTDPTVIRIIAVVLLFVTGLVPLFLAYLVLWVVIPERPAA